MSGAATADAAALANLLMAEAGDLAPPRLGDRSWFAELDADVYMNHAAVSPPSLLVRRTVGAVLDDYGRRGLGAVMTHVERRDQLRAMLAGLVGCDAADIGFVPNTTHGVLTIALCFPWRAGDRVLCFQGEFPTNVTPWQRAARTFDLQVDLLPLDGFDDGSGDGLARVRAQLKRGARIVAVSAVQFQTGLAMPIADLAALCHDHDAQLFVDGIQAVGIRPLQLRAWGVDYMSAGSHKWLMGPEGAAMLYVHPDRVGDLRPTIAGWLSHEEGMRFLFEGQGHLRYDRPIRKRANFVEVGAPNVLGLAGLAAGATPAVLLGMPAVAMQAGRVADALDQGLRARGFRSARAQDPAARSAIVSVRPPDGVDIVQLQRQLGQRGISCALPDGWLRFSPHWCNDLGQVPVVLDAVDAALAAS